MKKVRIFAWRVIVFCLIGIIMVSGWQVFKGMEKYYLARTQYNETTKIAKVALAEEFTGEINWNALKEQNSDIRAWIYLKDTIINYPVVRGADNDYYLYRMFNGQYNGAGSLFMDANAPDNFEGFNTVIYGHHMKDGSMFAGIDKYRSQDFYEQHKNMELITPTAKYHLEVIGFYQTLATSTSYVYSFRSDEDKQALIDYTSSHNILKGTPTANVQDNIVTLSTCVYATGDERYVLVTRMVPWTDEELKAARKEAELAANNQDYDSKAKSEKNKKQGFLYYIKRGFYILKTAL